jgi:hypothetical protein
MHGRISTEEELSSMVEDAPTATKHGHRRHVIGTVRGSIPEEVFIRGIHLVPTQ